MYKLIDINSLFTEDARKRALEQVKQESARKGEREARRIEKLRLELDKWEAGENIYVNAYGAPVRLRVKGENIETSHGANVPINDAIELLTLIRAREPVIGFKIGSYMVNSINKDFLVVGCHKIPIKEVLKIEKMLGVTTNV